MPDTNMRLQFWEEIANEKFFIINEQHSIATNKDM
jgi:hypothetical protein